MAINIFICKHLCSSHIRTYIYVQCRFFVGQYFHLPIAIPRDFVDVVWQLPRIAPRKSSSAHSVFQPTMLLSHTQSLVVVGYIRYGLWLSLGCLMAVHNFLIYLLSRKCVGGVKMVISQSCIFEDWSHHWSQFSDKRDNSNQQLLTVQNCKQNTHDGNGHSIAIGWD